MKIRLALALLVLCVPAAVQAQWTTDTYGGTTTGSTGHIGIGVPSHSIMRVRLTQPVNGDPDSLGGAYQLMFGTPVATWHGFRLDSNNNLHLDRQGGGWLEGVVFKLDGKVGVGTADPKGRLDVQGSTQLEPRIVFSGQEFYQASVTSTDGIALLLGVNRTNNRQLWLADTAALTQNGANTALRFAISNTQSDITSFGTDGSTPKPLVLNNNGGFVGIGVQTPAYKLDVNGTSRVTGDLIVTGNVSAKYQDVAEWVPVTEELQAGMVVVLDQERANHVLPSSKAYDTGVAGVVSAQPGVILGEAGPSKAMIATTGRVKVRVDATSGPVRIGDLLVTGTRPGTAMKSMPIDVGGVAIHRPGTVVGKALEKLDGGVGEILVLLSLQ